MKEPPSLVFGFFYYVYGPGSERLTSGFQSRDALETRDSSRNRLDCSAPKAKDVILRNHEHLCRVVLVFVSRGFDRILGTDTDIKTEREMDCVELKLFPYAARGGARLCSHSSAETGIYPGTTPANYAVK